MKLFSIIFRFFFTIWAYFTFLVLMLVVFFYHLVVVVTTKGKRVALLYKSYRPWARTWAFLNGVKIEVEGKDNFKEDSSYIFVCNHGSTGDLIIAASAMTNRYRPLGKKELTEIPFMGYMFSRALVLVDRSDPESRAKSMERMRGIIKQNISILIAPEGTRNRTDAPLQPFKEGAFRLAIEFQLPIIPMVLLNTRKLYPNNSLLMNHCDLKCHFLKPISTENLSEDDVIKLRDKVFKLIEKHVLQHDTLFAPTSKDKAHSAT